MMASQKPSQGLPLPSINAVHRNDNYLPLITTIYISISFSSVFINKYLTTASEYKFPYSSVTVFLQLIITVGFLQIWRQCQKRYLPSWLRLSKMTSTGWRQVLPCTVIYVMMMLLDPFFRTRVNATMYTAVQAWCILFALAWTMKFGHKSTGQQLRRRRGQAQWAMERTAWGYCLVQFIGIWFASEVTSESSWFSFSLTSSWVGLCYAALMVTYAVTIQNALVGLRHDVTLLLQWHLTLTTALTTLIVLVSGELMDAYRTVLFWDELGFWIQMIIGSLLAMVIHIFMILLIKYSSPLSYTVAATTKTCLQAIIAFLLFGNLMTGSQFLFLSVSLIGAICYAKKSTSKTIDSIYSM
ncbi:uncharacterized protein BX664DRAFT_331413 [Halteromyces radiatus]|uniref:uncharacterized protein n=1 Tax=Halteromyces radiatus TaxID=101107 RepID=UPI00221F5054|nr:uncharacterized protein BX664DRAFT_331413 [Halteromyces radiatus]KAI8088803.1 hypothetical protein BX664DRAFT_331413 [Halteromyces radiatus]